MSESANAWGIGAASIVTARVRTVSGARVNVEGPHFGAASARLAVAGAYVPREGDSVLVAMAEGGCFVIGVLRALREAAPQSLEAEDGSRASLEHDDEGVLWRLHDGEGRLVFEHRPEKSVVYVSEDLEVRAPGDIALSAGGEVRIESRERTVVGSGAALELRSDGSELSLDGDRARLSTSILETRAERAELNAKEARLVAGTLRSVVHRVRERADVVERTAGRVVERAREVYREVEELSQTKAGRLRLVAETAMTLLGQQTLVKAREDVKIKGEKIYLG